MIQRASIRLAKRLVARVLGLWLIGIAPVVLAAASVDGDARQPDELLYMLLAERLSLMRDVAAHKWHNDLPVEDRQREAMVLEAAVEDGLSRGFRPASSRRFFAVQIEAAKDIQNHWFGIWSRDGGPEAAEDFAGSPRTDLAADIRPRLLQLGQAIMDASAAPGVLHSEARFAARVNVPGLPPARRQALFESIQRLQRYPDRLTQILDTGVLRVGTTGDYPPFSDSEDGVLFKGVDIDLARDLAASLGVELVLVRTSWPTLMADLEAGAWDVGMSGISRTLSRARLGYFSAPYHRGGKLPIARCDASARFATLEDIDQPGVRVLVNPGGTNEAYVDREIEQARKILHSDNRTIFQALVDGTGDVMITDQIEVALQSRRRPELCATMDNTLTYQEKAFLMPRDEPLLEYVDTWLSLRMSESQVFLLFQHHLDGAR
jgi:cyclohexadienyl dehydratase